MAKKLDLHMSDTLNKIDLKVYEEEINHNILFTFDIFDSANDSKYILKLEEKIAALLFEGLNQIFIEDDTEYQTDEKKPSPSPNALQEISFKTLEDFFEQLKGCDKKHFSCTEDEENDDEEDF